MLWLTINYKALFEILWHFNDSLLRIHCWVCLWTNFKISQHLVKLQEARKLIVSRALCAWTLSCWKMKNSTEILSMARNSCCWLLLYRFLLGLDNYQTGVGRFHLPANTIRDCDWTLMMCDRILLRSVLLCCDSQLFCGLLGKYILISKLNNAHIIRGVGLLFCIQFSVYESCMADWQFMSCVAVCSLSSWAWLFLEHIIITIIILHNNKNNF